MDMQAMVEAQGHVLTGLEDTCSNTVKELEKGGQEVTVAVETAKRFRKVKDESIEMNYFLLLIV
jgi:hypothetical protein